MPAIIAAIGGMLITIAGSIVGRVLMALGLSITTYIGVSTTLDWLEGKMLDALDGTPEKILSLLAFMKVGMCLNIIVTAIMVRSVMKGVTGDSLKKWVLK